MTYSFFSSLVGDKTKKRWCCKSCTYMYIFFHFRSLAMSSWIIIYRVQFTNWLKLSLDFFAYPFVNPHQSSMFLFYLVFKIYCSPYDLKEELFFPWLGWNIIIIYFTSDCRLVPKRKKLVSLLQSALFRDWKSRMRFSVAICTKYVLNLVSECSHFDSYINMDSFS